MPVAQTKAKGRTRGWAPTDEGAVIAPDVSPPCLPPEKPPIAFVRGETLEPRQHVQKCESHAEAQQCGQVSIFC